MVRSGPGRVLAHGMVTGFFGWPIEIFAPHPDGEVGIRMELEEDPEVDEPQVRVQTVQVGIVLTLVGFDGPDGRGSADPVLVGERGSDLVFLHFRVFRFGASRDRTVHYTIFAADKEEVGWQPRQPVDDEV